MDNKKITQIMYYWKYYLNELKTPKEIEFKSNINDNGDILIRLRATSEYTHFKAQEISDPTQVTEGSIKEDIQSCSFFYFLPNKESST